MTPDPRTDVCNPWDIEVDGDTAKPWYAFSRWRGEICARCQSRTGFQVFVLIREGKIIAGPWCHSCEEQRRAVGGDKALSKGLYCWTEWPFCASGEIGEWQLRQMTLEDRAKAERELPAIDARFIDALVFAFKKQEQKAR